MTFQTIFIIVAVMLVAYIFVRFNPDTHDYFVNKKRERLAKKSDPERRIYGRHRKDDK